MMNKILTFAILILLSSCVGNNSDNRKSNTSKNKSSDKAQPKAEIASKEGSADEAQMTSDQLEKAAQIIAEFNDVSGELDGGKLYKIYCSICHGRKGNLNVNQAKDLTASNISLKNAVAQVYFGKGLMSPFKDILKEDQIIAVSKYVETLRK